MNIKTPTVYLLCSSLSALIASDALSANAAKADAEVIEIIGKRVINRNRVDTPAPKLVYDTAFFQRFEPISVGDMLKRVPGITFQSDIGEYAEPRMRGIGAEYTQILINGKRLPTFGNNHALAVDRIPAEMVDHIEIQRSPSADMDSQGVAGTLNIVLKDGALLEGGVWRSGSITNDETRASGYASYGNSGNEIAWGVSLNVQDRFNPKQTRKDTRSFEEGVGLGDFEDELQSDERDSRDIAFTSDLAFELDEDSRLSFNGMVIDTDREEFEDKRESGLEFDDDDLLEGFDQTNNEFNKIEQRTINIHSDYETVLGGSDLTVSLGYAQVDAEEDVLDISGDTGDILEFDGREFIETDDRNLNLKAVMATPVASGTWKYGIEVNQKDRDFLRTAFEDDGSTVNDNDEFADFNAKENRLDGFVSYTFNPADAWVIELGLRAETTDLDITGADFDGNGVSETQDNTQLNPSLHMLWNLGDYQQLRFSLAQTARRPDFDQLNPVALVLDDDEEIFTGNPELKQERSVGVDLGYDYHIRAEGNTGVVGFNAFYREVEDLIQGTVTDVEIDGSEFELSSVTNNTNKGEFWGLEFDSSLPITSQLSVFANYTWLDSEIEDEFLTGITRRFSNQSNYVYNLGFDYNLSAWDMTFGMSFQKQGNAQEFNGEEVVDVSVDGNLELFLEKKFTNQQSFLSNMVIRLTAQNILDAEREETTRVYGDIDAFKAGFFEEQEIDIEETSPVVMLTLRGGF